MATSNPFDILGDDDNDDPSHLIAVHQQKIASMKAVTAAEPEQTPAKLPTKPLPPAQAVREARVANAAPSRGGGGVRGGRGRGGRGRGFRPNGNVEGFGGGERQEGDSGKGGDREGGSYEGSRQPYGGGGGYHRDGYGNSEAGGDGRPPRRVFERRSGTGRGNEFKREGTALQGGDREGGSYEGSRQPYGGGGGYHHDGYENNEAGGDGRPPRRVFERRSGTGRGNEFKREGTALQGGDREGGSYEGSRQPYGGGGYHHDGYENNEAGGDGRPPRRVFERRSGTGRGNEFKREGTALQGGDREGGSYEGSRQPYGGGGYHHDGYENNEAGGDGRPPRRLFERRSGTGRGNEFKREGSGRGNWGTPTDEVIVQEPVEAVDLEDKASNPENQLDKKNAPTSETINDNKDGVAKEEEKEEDKEMTLEEYEKIREEKRKALLSMKAKERRVDLYKEFKSMQQLSIKKENNDVFIKLGSNKDSRKKDHADKEDKAKKSVSINEFLKPAEGESYYRPGGRGRGRGRGDRGTHQGGFGRGGSSLNAEAAIKIEDPGQFPTLGGK